MKSIYIKYIAMVVAAICAIVCFVVAYIQENLFIAVISLFSSFVPIAVWFLDARENDKSTQKLKERIAEMEKSLEWEEI